MSTAAETHVPRFMVNLHRRSVVPAPFAVVPVPPAPILAPQPERIAEPPPVPPPPIVVAPPPVAVAAPPAPVPVPPPQDFLPDRLREAIERLRLVGSSLAEQARADALEIGFLVAKRILDGEVRAAPEALFSLVRGALERVGQARSVTVRLCPADAERVEAAGGAHAWSGLTIAEVNVVADTTLSTGDVVVDSDLGHVDGRLDTRLAELRAAAPTLGSRS